MRKLQQLLRQVISEGEFVVSLIWEHFCLIPVMQEFPG